MKVLVADDDAVIRRLLTALLNKLGHEVEAVEDGNSALKSLEASLPDLAILDWMMPGLNGIEVCKRLRAQPTKSRPYILLLSAKSDKSDIIAGLDAGADDYLVKPFDAMSSLARFRVAQRAIAHQQELQRHIRAMEDVLQRHNLLGELPGKQGGAADTTAGKPTESPRPARTGGTKPPVPPLAIPDTLVPDRLNELLVRGLAEIGLGNAQAQTIDENSKTGDAQFTAWAPLVLPREALWVDLMIEADDVSAVAKFEALLGRIPVSERELLDFLAETFNLLVTAVRSYLAEKGGTVLMPVISRSLRSSSLNIQMPRQAQISRHLLTLPGIQLTVSAVRQNAPVRSKTLGQLREFDLLAENLPSPSTTEVFLLNQGVTLNTRYIEKLVSLTGSERRDFRVPVIEPSPLTEFFCLGRVSPR